MERELKALNRKELIDIIYQLKKNEQKLQKENEELKSRLEDKRIKIENAGSVAEASIALADVFKAAQSAADKYLAEIEERQKSINGDCELLLNEAKEKAETMVREASERKTELEEEAKKAYRRLKSYEAELSRMKKDRNETGSNRKIAE